MEEKVLKALVDAAIAFVVAHPRIAGIVGALYAIALLWKMQPKEKRDACRNQRGVRQLLVRLRRHQLDRDC